MRETLRKVVMGKVLTADEAEQALQTVMKGSASVAAIASLLTALSIRGESVEEIVGFARAMRQFAARVKAPEDVVDTCGTGGDAKGTINISTAAAFVARGAGAVVAKHGNRSATSKCGSADVLEELGADIELSPDQVSACIARSGVGFMFARTHHPAMKHVAPVRAELPFRTVFNLLGPLTNPAGARRQLVGVFRADYVRPVAEALKELGAERVLVVHGADGMDEITVTGPTYAAELRNGRIEEFEITPESVGLSRHGFEGLLGGDAPLNAGILTEILSGEERGAARDITLINAGATLYVAGKADSIQDGVRHAQESIDSGAALEALEVFISTTRKLRGTLERSG